ncbi:hypothetical protein JCM5353_005164 [Sporobolomyces roseus]
MSTTPSTKSLERKLKALRSQEQLVGRWLNLITLSIALLYWVLEGQGFFSGWGKRQEMSSSGKSYMGWIGGALAIVKLSVRWYYTKERKGLEIELLEREPSKKELDKKKSKKSKR